jgi:hypothetical protein
MDHSLPLQTQQALHNLQRKLYNVRFRQLLLNLDIVLEAALLAVLDDEAHIPAFLILLFEELTIELPNCIFLIVFDQNLIKFSYTFVLSESLVCLDLRPNLAHILVFMVDGATRHVFCGNWR